jgi:hypothetical protein
MITKTQSFTTSDKQIFATIEEAQQHELYTFLKTLEMGADDDETKIAAKLLSNKDKIIDLLTTKANSRPAARKANGAKRKPKASVAQTGVGDVAKSAPEPSLI